MILKSIFYSGCKECGKTFDNNTKFSKHLREHGLDIQTYYDKYYKKENEDFCKKCGSNSIFRRSILSFENKIKTEFIGYWPLCKKCNIRGITKEKFVYVYGEKIGLERWESYCEKQRLTNLFEYKRDKYGWSEEQYKEYNQSLAVTLDNQTRRWGEEEGKKRFIIHDCIIYRLLITRVFFNQFGNNLIFNIIGIFKSKVSHNNTQLIG